MNTSKKILFIAKEKQSNQLSILVQRQMRALQVNDKSLNIKHYACKGTDFSGYISIYKNLNWQLKQNDFDILHSHYSLIGILTLLARKKEKVVVSFMGSDVYFNSMPFRIARWYVLKKASHIIVKSNVLLKKLPQQKNISVIPNGVNMELFQPMHKIAAKEQLSWQSEKIHILFPAGKDRYEKNYPLAEQAVKALEKNDNIEFHLLENVPSDRVPLYLNAADIVLLTSRWEGSSNVTKEAMACNTIVVSTDVGDARELFEGLEGYYLTDHSPEDVKEKIESALRFSKEGKTVLGRQRLIDLKLDESSIAERIISIYETLIV